LGANGAGKTTLLRLIGAELRADRGTVQVANLDARREATRVKALLGVIPQAAGLYGTLTVEEHLRLFAPLKGIRRESVRGEVDRVMDLTGLCAMRARATQALSGGQQRRVLIALALLGDPPVLLLDEPTVGLDPVIRQEIWALVDALRRADKAVLLTSHYLDEIDQLADHVTIIDKGCVVAAGTRSQLLADMKGSVRLTLYDATRGTVASHRYVDSLEEAQSEVRRLSPKRYAIAPIQLEDVYLRVVSRSGARAE
jgi:lipooligosaccharide transport system ATP-binding protein